MRCPWYRCQYENQSPLSDSPLSDVLLRVVSKALTMLHPLEELALLVPMRVKKKKIKTTTTKQKQTRTTEKNPKNKTNKHEL